jgi:hypothetical protein
MKRRQKIGCPRCLGVFLAAFLGLPLGCHSLNLLLPATPERQAKAGKEVAQALPAQHSFFVASFVFVSDFEVKQDLPLFRELARLRDQVYRELQLPSAPTLVHVFLFEDREKYERFMRAKYPDLPKRRAFFVAQPRSVGGPEDFLVYTFWSDRVRADLRHELTHALLHSVLKDVPLWLDEGIAEYFETPPDEQGMNAQHLRQIRLNSNGPFHPDLAHLEQLSQVQQMTPAEYREAWAWVHLMLHDRPEAKKVLLHYLQQLRTTPNPGSLRPRLTAVYPDPENTLEKHLAGLDMDQRPEPTVQR